MATQAYIIQDEDTLVAAIFAARYLKGAFELEKDQGEGTPIPENRDCWGTVYCNARALRKVVDKLIASLESEFK